MRPNLLSTSVLLVGGLGVALGVSLAQSRAHAQELAHRNARVAANVALGFAGELDALTNRGRSEVDLDPSVGFDIRVELPVLDFLVVGGWFEFLGVEQDVSGAEREESFSFDGFARARWVFEVVPAAFFIEPYVLLPLGFTMGVLPDDDGSGDDIWPGWNTAVLAGAQFLHASGFGGYLELGWRHAEAYLRQTFPILGSFDVSLVLNELALNIGFVYAFGGA